MMTRLPMSALAGVFIFHLTAAAAQAQQAWEATQPSPSKNGHGHMVKDSGGNVIMTAPYNTIVKFRASDGAVLWNILWDGTSNSSFGQLAIDAGDNVYVSGTVTRFDSGGNPIAVLVVTKLSPSGSIVWTGRQDLGTVSEHSSGGAIALGSNGSLYVIGTRGNSSAPTAPATLVRMSTSTGAVQLPTVSLGGVIDFSADMPMERLLVDSSNNVYWSSASGLTRYSSTLGSPVTWSGHLPVRGMKISGTSVYITGPQASSSSSQMYVAKLTTGLATTWKYLFRAQPRSAPYPGLGEIGTPGSDTTYGGNAVTVDSSGNVYAAGDAVTSNGSFTGGALAKFNASGQLLWAQQIGNNGLDAACFDVAVSPNNRVVVGCTDMQVGNGTSTAIADL
ncbi:MAG TPA: PQQ-binding-like beta-propeller repeat protein [Acidobacteriaceae bacterium]|nr:PQQ-binding-like beta-propeller repeat protein [Acidobacteriaceae bacterium]